MARRKRGEASGLPSPIFIVSGGDGSSGEHLVRTALAQFEADNPSLVAVPRTYEKKQVESAVKQAAAVGGTIVHTLVNPELRQLLTRRAREKKVVSIDLIGRVLNRLSRVLKKKPLGQPGRYRQLRRDYFERIGAIEFTVAHDDGRNVEELDQAEIILIGVSRLGKTPLSVYLGTLGWRVANVPIVPDVPPPEELFRVDARRVVGLTMDAGQLLYHRRVRGHRLGMGNQTAYTSVSELRKEILSVRNLCRKHGFSVVDVTNKPIEESAQDVIARVPGKER